MTLVHRIFIAVFEAKYSKNLERLEQDCGEAIEQIDDKRSKLGMAKVFNTTAVCIPEKHYMVNLDSRLLAIKKLVDDGKYFLINRARQYGKTTILMALSRYLKDSYYVVSIDFQTFGSEEFRTEENFARTFAGTFSDSFLFQPEINDEGFQNAMEQMQNNSEKENYTLRILFRDLRLICAAAEKPVVLLIDEVDSASNNQVFLDFLAQLRALFMQRELKPAFQSVILAGVYDVKNLKLKIRPEEEHKYNSPWNIAADFKVEMSFSKEDIAGMLWEYEADFHTGMDISRIAGDLYDYTSGYPFLVSRLCQLMDEEISAKEAFGSRQEVWTEAGFQAAVRMLLYEKNTLFDSLIGKLHEYPKLNTLLRSLLFTGKSITYNADETAIDIATMFGFVKNKKGLVEVANRIFETRLYNYFLSTAEMQESDVYKASVLDKNQFVVDGHLDMKRILERFVVHFHDIFGDCNESFMEEQGRKYFLLYLRPIINGTGNYYVEARTRDLRRTDVIVDYLGEQFIIEMKIWHGPEYNERGKKQLVDYLDTYHVEKGYLLSFNFNKKKEIGVHEIEVDGKKIIEAVV